MLLILHAVCTVASHAGQTGVQRSMEERPLEDRACVYISDTLGRHKVALLIRESTRAPEALYFLSARRKYVNLNVKRGESLMWDDPASTPDQEKNNAQTVILIHSNQRVSVFLSCVQYCALDPRDGAHLRSKEST